MGPRGRKDVEPLHRLNQELAERALRSGRGNASHRPTQVYLQIASGCNLDCYMCSEHNRPEGTKHGRNLKSFSRELFAKLEREVFPYSSRLMLGVGGEPTISDDFVYFLERAWGAGQEVQLLSNGTRLGNDRLAQAVADCVSELQISIDAATKDTYERIRIGSRWNSIRKSLANLDRYRMQHSAEERSHFSLCFVLMKSNLHELPAFVELAKEFNADRVHGQHVIGVTDQGRGESLVDEPERYADIRAQAMEVAAKLGIDLHVPAPYAHANGSAATAPSEHGEPSNGATNGATHVNGEPPSLLAGHRIPCQNPTLDVFIFYDGRVFPCCHPFAHRKMQVGDLNTQSFHEIWNSRTYRNLRVGLKSGDVPMICRNCSIVHDPPPAYEDLEALEREPDLVNWYGERDLEPDDTQLPLYERLASNGMLDYVAALDRHSRNLESDRNGLAAHARNLELMASGNSRHINNVEHELAMLRSVASRSTWANWFRNARAATSRAIART